MMKNLLKDVESDVKTVAEKGEKGVEYVKKNAGRLVKKAEQNVKKGAEIAETEAKKIAKEGEEEFQKGVEFVKEKASELKNAFKNPKKILVPPGPPGKNP